MSNLTEFEKHFGVPHSVFLEIVDHLDDEQHQLLEATIEVNPEAAVLWILHMEEIEPLRFEHQ